MRGIRIALLLALAAVFCGACARVPDGDAVAVYLGVEDYGTVKASEPDTLRCRFFCGGEVISVPIRSEDYAVRNRLQEGAVYRLTFTSGAVAAAEKLQPAPTGARKEDACVWRVEIEAGGARVTPVSLVPGEQVCAVRDAASRTLYVLPNCEAYTPPVSGTPGERTILNLLKTAMTPVGTTLYVYGGGWNWEDTAASGQTTAIGLPEEWVTFFQTRDADYHYKSGDAAHSFYPFGGFNEYGFAGADCSGFVGWTLYNTLYDHDGEAGLVFPARDVATTLAERGWGGIVSEGQPFCPSDVVSMAGHVWIALGTCADGSVVLVHSAPCASRTGALGGGVHLSAIGADTGCAAYRLAQDCMTRFYPAWSERYSVPLHGADAYCEGRRFRWYTQSGACLSDPEGVQLMSAEAVLHMLFKTGY